VLFYYNIGRDGSGNRTVWEILLGLRCPKKFAMTEPDSGCGIISAQGNEEPLRPPTDQGLSETVIAMEAVDQPGG
jgi:hypothetical protein